MTARPLIDPELLIAIDSFPPPAVDQGALDARREMLPSLLPTRESYAREDVAIEDHVVPGPPEVPVIVYRPRGLAAPSPAYLHIHGGGYVFGNAEMCGPQNVATATASQCVVVSVDYRLAPETRAPGSVEDCYTVLRWLHRQADAVGIVRDRIAIGGESAGGGLASALALLARDRGEVAIRFQMLLSAMLDDRTVNARGIDPYVGEFVWTNAQNAFGWRSLLGCEPGSDDVSPYCAPARAEDLSRLPPAYIAVGAHDLFRDENIDFAQRLLRAGVPTELHVIPGAYHGFERCAEASIVKRAQEERHLALKRALHST